ncbi:DUF3667 domain-containing protein [Rubrivirga marina]|uniref:Uncharacterized protein n=1 Tax=Rubrivirga marina TaxID=1196024 RepID=A0A271J179_9BACT|nr:DUF3667 domain-containing protein [Rubrivirga marina]PAP76794.1 hypothetical protein BSZ37_10280 [Rubrivirga marina]
MPDVLPALAPDVLVRGDGAPAAICLQCATPLVGAYCHACGQHESVADRLTFRSLWRDFRKRRLNLDRGLFRTLLDVVRRPGAVADAFVEGRRQTYTHPITLLFVVYAVYALLLSVIGDRVDGMMMDQFERQLAARPVDDAELAAFMDAYLDGVIEAFHLFYTYGAYFAVFMILPFALACRWLLGDRGRTLAECAVLGAYIEVAVVLPSMLVFTPLSAALGNQWIGSAGLLLYVGYAAWSARGFFDRRLSTAALSAFSMVLALVVYFGAVIGGSILYGAVVAIQAMG